MALGEYIFRILCTGLICGAVSSVPMGGSGKKVVRLVCGMMLTVSLLSPLPGIDFQTFGEDLLIAPGQIPLPVEQGQDLSRESLTQLIIQETEAYILHKAAALGMEITVDVALAEGEYPVPQSAAIRGTWTEEQKQSLSAMMETELGITGEDQRWIG